ncbi:MAG: putative signal transducing protein [Bacteroidota bacterium]
MNDWIIITTFTYPHEAHLAKAKLESEGINVQLRDEMTTQVHNFYSNAIGGVKFLVQENDYTNAYKLLIDSGYLKEPEQSENKLVTLFDKKTSGFPLIGKSMIEVRFIIVVTFILILLGIITYLLTLS